MNESMLDRLLSMENRFEELGHMLMDPDIGSDIKKMTEVTKEQASLQTAFDLFQEYKAIQSGIEDAKELMKENDPNEYQIKDESKKDEIGRYYCFNTKLFEKEQIIGKLDELICQCK